MPDNGPYIVTARRRMSPDPVVHPQIVSRHTVATLEEAREKAGDVAIYERHVTGPDQVARVREIADALPESGGTVGPLPDGTVIEVTHAR